jgi:hypothetical protein
MPTRVKVDPIATRAWNSLGQLLLPAGSLLAVM